MRSCCLCNKNVEREKGTFFNIPKDERIRKKWSENCRINFTPNSRICMDHFSSSDIIKRTNKVSLLPNAVPFVLPVNDNSPVPLPDEEISSEKNCPTDLMLDTSIEYVQINTTGTSNQKCRCCSNPTANFIKLDVFFKTPDESEKTYKDLLYELTKLSISAYQEINMPQQICEKCGAQLRNAYKFIQQACKVSKQYLQLVQLNTPEDIKNIEQLQESLIEISAPIAEQLHDELKVEPLSVECNMDIKEENEESEVFLPMISNNEESQEERDFLQNSNTDEHSSEDDEDSDEPESVKDVDEDLNDETLARCCDICHKVYRNEKFLKIHKRYTHMPEEDKLPCPLCSYKASRSSALKVHMGLVHGHDKVKEYFKPVLDSGKKYPCNLCPRSYGRKDSLRKHVRRKHLNKPSKEETPTKKTKPQKPKDKERFLCTYCGQSYSSKCGLESHVLTHTGERPFSCEICSKTFKRLKDLQLHRVIHSDEKPHQCSECGKAFKRVDKLKIHMRVHSELRPYKCNECEKTFKYPSVLRTHMHIHTGQTPFACKTCGEAFSLRTSLNNHCLKNGHVKLKQLLQGITCCKLYVAGIEKMRSCCLCNKNVESKNGMFFNIPKDERIRKKWSEVCRINFTPNSRICVDHFSSSDIINRANKVSLMPNAVPFVLPVKANSPVALPDEDISSEKICPPDLVWETPINTSGTSIQKCRCCSNPTANFIKLDDFIKTAEKTYKDLLYELTKLSLSTYQEFNMPQQICKKCGAQLRNAYKFIQQACNVSKQYLELIDQQNTQEDIKNIELLQESLIEISAPIAEQLQDELKVEPLDIECNVEIKEEIVESEVFLPMISNNEESQEEKDFLQISVSNTTEHSSENDEDSDEPESVKDVDEDINDETLPRCCDICHKVYLNEKFLKIHKRYTHMPEEDKLPCPLCSYKASRSSDLKVHMGLVHGPDKVTEYFKPVLVSAKKYPCNLCSRSYSRIDSLRRHVSRKHLNNPSQEEKPTKKIKDKKRFLCTYCGQSCSTNCGLESHMLTHTGERPFSCEICSKTFKRLKDLQLHRVIHSDEKPHKCSECGKGFKRVDKLKIHMRVHSELRPYKCNECEKTFKYPNVLRTHMNIHTGQTSFAYKPCGEAFSLRTSLNYYHCLKNGNIK
ncbi:LOW QUALITY PROTEIN: zinc finger protein 568-like [Calliphora vicina]|uniref:LOW QUALITY PROTEIN: zinc finger protein 568-like n=1 Tax=Calliphora vicina TaxID=7373 RepID=UPI00325B3C7C